MPELVRDALVDYALREGLDDWVAVGYLTSAALSLGASDDATALEWAADAAGYLSDRGYVVFGWVQRDDGWRAYEEPPAVVLDNLRRGFVASGSDYSNWYLWLKLTPDGIAAANRTSAST